MRAPKSGSAPSSVAGNYAFTAGAAPDGGEPGARHDHRVTTETATPAEADARAAAVASACRRYLVATRSASDETYDVIEKAEWENLLSTLERVGRPLHHPPADDS